MKQTRKTRCPGFKAEVALAALQADHDAIPGKQSNFETTDIFVEHLALTFSLDNDTTPFGRVLPRPIIENASSCAVVLTTGASYPIVAFVLKVV